LCILLHRGRINFIHQNLKTFVPAREDNREHGTAESSLLWQITAGRRDRTKPVNFRTLPRRRGITHVGNNSYRSSSHLATATAPVLRWKSVSVELRQRTLTSVTSTLRRGCFPRHRLHLQAGEGVRTR